MNKHRWGIIGTGMIAHKMADAINMLDNAEVTAVLSRTMESAKIFSKEYDIPNQFIDLTEFAESNLYDIAYVATPHNNHKRETIACLKSGKAVLCEKPMGVNVFEVEEMIQVAKEENQLLVEAFWTYYFPAVQKAFELIKEGVIGKPLMVDARFCFYIDVDPLDRKFNPNLAGGALLDIGLYCISFAQKVFNEEPEQIMGMPVIGETGIDESSSYILEYSGNRLATLTSSFRTATHNDAWIFGEKGSIRIPMFWQPDDMILMIDGKEKKFNFERLGNGYTYEAIKTMKYLEEKQKESKEFSLKDSQRLIKIMDKLRNDWGLIYPFEK